MQSVLNTLFTPLPRELLSAVVFLNMYNVAWIIFGVAPGVYTETVHHNLNEPKCKDTPEK